MVVFRMLMGVVRVSKCSFVDLQRLAIPKFHSGYLFYVVWLGRFITRSLGGIPKAKQPFPGWVEQQIVIKQNHRNEQKQSTLGIDGLWCTARRTKNDEAVARERVGRIHKNQSNKFKALQKPDQSFH